MTNNYLQNKKCYSEQQKLKLISKNNKIFYLIY